MRILIATHHRAIVGGIETYLRELLPALRDRGHALALAYENPAVGSNVALDGGQADLPAWRLGETHALGYIEAWRPEVVYLHGVSEPSSERALLSRFPSVLFAHGYFGTCVSGTKRHATARAGPCTRTLGPACLALYYPRRCGGLNPISMLRDYKLQRRRRALLGRYQAVLVASAYMQEEYRRHGVAEDRLHLLPLFPPGLAPDPSPPAPRSVSGRVLMVGRLTALKGGSYLLGALRQASAALGQPLSLVVAGDGPDRPSLEAQARALGVRAQFAGWVEPSTRTRLMRESDVLAVPSVWPEPFGLVGIEAACVGLPAVAYAVGGIRDWLIPGESGELAPGDPPTPAGFAEALVRALASPAHLSRLGVGAWRVASRFTLDRHVCGLEAVLEGILRAQVASDHRRVPAAGGRSQRLLPAPRQGAGPFGG
jgi:glycosyltransferase involved in cell wall biosynthesis